ncbi:MAG: type II toxin-antitoxin system prevent-host-death family antitoxin [Potamolinea sp.]
MQIVEIAEANATLAEYTSGLSEEPLIITNNGQPIAVLVTLENLDLETLALSSNPKFLELIERSRARRREEGGIYSIEMRRRLGLNEV